MASVDDDEEEVEEEMEEEVEEDDGGGGGGGANDGNGANPLVSLVLKPLDGLLEPKPTLPSHVKKSAYWLRLD